VIEVQQFRLQDGVDDDSFIAVDARAQQEFFYAQRGLRRRTTARSTDGQWISICFWDDDASADSAVCAVRPPCLVEMQGLIDTATVTRSRYHEL
jgi:hypothetical protein